MRPLRQPERRYQSLHWDELRQRRGMTWEQVLQISKERYEDAAARGMSHRVICINRLDNPFCAWDAYLTILAEIEKQRAAKRNHCHRYLAHKGTWPARRRAMAARKAAAMTPRQAPKRAPGPKYIPRVPMMTKVSSETREAIEKLAALDGVTLSFYISTLLDNHVRRHAKRLPA